jgi:hypothetical protein
MGQGSLTITRGTDEQNPVTGFQIVGPKKVSPVVLFYDLLKHGDHLVWKYKIFDPNLRGDFEEKPICSLILD